MMQPKRTLRFTWGSLSGSLYGNFKWQLIVSATRTSWAEVGLVKSTKAVSLMEHLSQSNGLKKSAHQVVSSSFRQK